MTVINPEFGDAFAIALAMILNAFLITVVFNDLDFEAEQRVCHLCKSKISRWMREPICIILSFLLISMQRNNSLDEHSISRVCAITSTCNIHANTNEIIATKFFSL